ncbi:hypothetical protein KK137_04065 [Croceibacterium sp. LX-88]|jgi:hypothetical protein|uniref:HdeA/HdeB family protein n=1 Tax=Croceibacterium selenioxidans TaxID=2838833 RepID=A0ABS5W152_9SPHN|nr:hypothetical protein [Croceibacterium selenioxidans]MBT2133503.1 hypothetical protein [Croceibacterium selenioxidans]
MAALVIASPLAAQGPAPMSPEAERDLECAMWAALVSGSVEDPEIKTAFGFAMTYWVGRFEGRTGRNFDEFATGEFVTSLEPKAEDLRERCVPEMESMGKRMQDWGQRMQDAPAPQ